MMRAQSFYMVDQKPQRVEKSVQSFFPIAPAKGVTGCSLLCVLFAKCAHQPRLLTQNYLSTGGGCSASTPKSVHRRLCLSGGCDVNVIKRPLQEDFLCMGFSTLTARSERQATKRKSARVDGHSPPHTFTARSTYNAFSLTFGLINASTSLISLHLRSRHI